VRRLLVVAAVGLRERQRVPEIESVDVGEREGLPGDPCVLAQVLLERIGPEGRAPPRFRELIR